MLSAISKLRITIKSFKCYYVKNLSYWTGEGILIAANPDDLIQFVDNQKQAYVVQKYIEKPFLLTGRRKFDIR